jgi:hypothetical protein
MKAGTRDLILLYLLALLVNGVVAWLVADPGYVDAYYYFNGGRLIAAGKPLVDPYLWNYAYPATSAAIPAFAYWQPLPSFLAAAGIVLFGRGNPFDSAQVMYVLTGSCLPLITYAVARQLTERRIALVAGLLTVFSGFYAVYWSLPESFTPFALSGAGVLALIGLGRKSGAWWAWLAAGACAGLAHLSRADGVLLLAVAALMALLPAESVSLNRRLRNAGLSVAGYLVVMAPWFARNLAVFGGLQAPGGLSTLWLVDYNDLFNYPSNLTAARYFGAGWGVILGDKGRALLGNLATFVGVHNMVFLLPLTIIGLWRHWRDDWLLPAVVYGAALFAAMTFAFTWPGVRGGWFHSGAALLPFVDVAAALGLDSAVRFGVRHRANWRYERASGGFGGLLIGLAAAVTAALIAGRVVGFSDWGRIAWNEQNEAYAEIDDALDLLGASLQSVVMVNNPPGFYYYTGRGGVPLPNGDEETLLRAAEDFGASFLVVDRNVVPALQSLYADGPRSDRLTLVDTFGGEDDPVYLYRIACQCGDR